MKKSELKMMIRQVVREEIRTAMKDFLVESKQPKAKKKIVEKKAFSKNSILNDVLNETANNDEWKTMGGGTYDSGKMGDIIAKKYGNDKGTLVQSTAAAVGANPDALPDHVTDALTKDYRAVLKATDEKAKEKRNI